MAIILSWKNNNPPYNTVKVYRSQAGFDMAALPEPMITLAGDAKSYIDESIDDGGDYSYLIEVTNGSERLFCKTPTVTHLKNRGPGPARLIMGDSECGYYGTVSLDELPDAVSSFGLDARSLMAQTNGIPMTYHKFAWKGRILYYATTPLYGAHSLRNSQNKILRSGLKYPFEWPAKASESQNIRNKNKYSFHARVPRSTPENWDGVLSADNEGLAMIADSEFNQLLGAIVQYTPIGERKLTGLPIYKPSAVVGHIAVADPVNAAMAVHGDSTVSARFGYSAGTTGAPPTLTYTGSKEIGFEPTGAINRGWYKTVTNNHSTQYATIWPVFELIED